MLPTQGANGTPHHTTLPVPVPANTQQLGLSVYLQWLVLENGPAGLTGAVTRAMRTTVVQ